MFTGGAPAPTPGTWTPDGTPATIDAGAGAKEFPGICLLDAGRVLLAYYSGTTHYDGKAIIGRLGSLTGSSVSWGAEFTIISHATRGLRCEDALSVIDGKVTLAGRYYDIAGDENEDPFILVCDDLPASLTDSSTWTRHDVTLTAGADENMVHGHVIKVGSSYLIGASTWDGSTPTARVLTSSSLTDWSSPTSASVGEYSEVSIGRLSGPDVLALLRRESDKSTWKSLSSDQGASFGSPSSAHDGYGFPTFRRLYDTTLLTVYRDSPAGDTAWRTSANSGTTWSDQTVLDTTSDTSVYASLLQLDFDTVLCVYAVENSAETDGDIYSQVFTRG